VATDVERVLGGVAPHLMVKLVLPVQLAMGSDHEILQITHL
jgi:hypothetical protein